MINVKRRKLSTSKKSSARLGRRVEYKLLLSRDNKKVIDTGFAFSEFADRWRGDLDLDVVKEFKVLGLNENNIVVCRLSVEIQDQKEALTKILETLTAKSTRIKPKRIILGENSLFGVVKPNHSETLIAKEFKQTAQDKFNIQVVDHLIMSNNSYYSFADNHYRFHSSEKMSFR